MSFLYVCVVHIILNKLLFKPTSIVHILSPETYDCPSWISGRERMSVEKYFMINIHERMSPTRRESNLQTPDHQSDSLLCTLHCSVVLAVRRPSCWRDVGHCWSRLDDLRKEFFFSIIWLTIVVQAEKPLKVRVVRLLSWISSSDGELWNFYAYLDPL